MSGVLKQTVTNIVLVSDGEQYSVVSMDIKLHLKACLTTSPQYFLTRSH
jgi:hypothetical protein